MRTTKYDPGKDGVRGLLHPVWIHVIESKDEVEPFLDGIAAKYVKIFAEHPYYEDFSNSIETEINPWFRCYADDGVLYLSTTTEQLKSDDIIGFAGSINADHPLLFIDLNCKPGDKPKEQVGQFLARHQHLLEVPQSSYLYMAELAVQGDFRGKGLGLHLIQRRLEAARSSSRFTHLTHVLMRTALKDSNSAHLYEGLGAKQIPGLIQDVTLPGKKPDLRMFMSMPLR